MVVRVPLTARFWWAGRGFWVFGCACVFTAAANIGCTRFEALHQHCWCRSYVATNSQARFWPHSVSNAPIRYDSPLSVTKRDGEAYRIYAL